MNRYKGLFREVPADEVLMFEAKADSLVEEATDVLEVSAIWHPLVRRRIGELLIERAEAEMHDLVPGGPSV